MIFIASDHAGFPLKEEIKKYLLGLDYEMEDLSSEEIEPHDDYPDFASKIVEKVSENFEENKGISFCGTGQGICMALNKFKGIRACVAWDEYTARAARQHLDSNVLCLGGRALDPEVAKMIVKIWLETEFSGEERYIRRLEKVKKMEE